MSPEIQTIVALVVVATAAIWLVVRATRKNGSGCATDCGAVSPDVKRLQARLKRTAKRR